MRIESNANFSVTLSKQGTHYHLLYCQHLNKSSSSAFRPALPNLWLLLVIIWFQGNFSCGTQWVVLSGQDSSMLPAWVANHSAGLSFIIFPAHRASHIIRCLIHCLFWQTLWHILDSHLLNSGEKPTSMLHSLNRFLGLNPPPCPLKIQVKRYTSLCLFWLPTFPTPSSKFPLTFYMVGMIIFNNHLFMNLEWCGKYQKHCFVLFVTFCYSIILRLRPVDLFLCSVPV